jgi:mannitol-1-phosphate 5-dehydrogenase
MRLLQIGAGKIGRSFIGQLFSRAGYEVVFADVDRTLVDRLNRAGEYRVVIKSESGDEVILVRPVRAVWMGDERRMADEMAGADIAGISVGQEGLTAVLPTLARGLEHRRKSGVTRPLDIILAENMRDAADYVFRGLRATLSPDFPSDTMPGLVETSIGKMVPIMSAADLQADPLQVFAEPYNTLILDRNAFKNPVPDVAGLEPRDCMKAWVDRKSFIHNLGHAAAAYYGHYVNPDAVYLWEVLEDAGVRNFCFAAMGESASALLAEYPGVFEREQLNEHALDLIRRFRNRALGDTIHRVGRDLKRKLGPDDRIMGALKLALRHGLPYQHILSTLVHALHFRADGPDGRPYAPDESFLDETGKAVETVLCGHGRLDPEEYPAVLAQAQALHSKHYTTIT